MRHTKIKGLASALVAIMMIAFAGSASAAMISGDITFSGDFDIDGSLRNATSISFPGGDFDVDGTNGDFSSVSQGDIGTVDNLDFNPFAPGYFGSVGGFDFNLDSVTILVQTNTFLLLEGMGFVTGNGIMQTPVSFTFSANVNGPLMDWSAGFTAQPVPVPAAIWLLGSALAALGIRRK